jgi:hypothetical protein
MFPRSLKIRIGAVVTYEGRVYVVRRIFSDGPFILIGLSPSDKDMIGPSNFDAFEVRYIDTEYKFRKITFLQI